LHAAAWFELGSRHREPLRARHKPRHATARVLGSHFDAAGMPTREVGEQLRRRIERAQIVSGMAPRARHHEVADLGLACHANRAATRFCWTRRPSLPADTG
jgi:hypothetical protein